MRTYTYYFADGTKNTIEIDDKWYDILHQMDEDERKARYNYGRRISDVMMRRYGNQISGHIANLKKGVECNAKVQG